MILSQGRGYIFIHIPKTGGTSLAAALETRAMADDILVGDTPKAKRRRGRLDGLKPKGRLWKHSTLADIDGLPGTDRLDEFCLITLVRNPWDRAVSYYAWARDQDFDHPVVVASKSLDFKEFLHDMAVSRSLQNSPARSYLTDAAGFERPAVYARLEELGDDLNPFWDHLGFRLDVPHLNSSDRTAYRDYYDAASQAQIARLQAEDIERFGYSF